MLNPEKFELQLEAKKEERPEEKEKREIELMEKSPLALQDKIDLVLVYLKEKPAAWLGNGVRFYKTEKEKERQNKLKRLDRKGEETRKVLENLSLPSYSFKYESEEEKTILVSYDFLVGRDLEKLNRLKEAWQSGITKDLGLALGYPESAVEGFINGQVLDREKDFKRLPKKDKKELKKEGVLKFLNFGLSKNNWREELELVRRYQRVIQEKSPRIYDKIIKTKHDPLIFRGRIETVLERILNRLEYYKRGFKK